MSLKTQKILGSAAVLLFLALGLVQRFEERNLHYMPNADSALFTFWAQSIAEADRPGFELLLSPGALSRHPETALYQWAAILYTDLFRTVNTAGLAISVVWMKIAGSGLLSAQILAMLAGAFAALLLAKRTSDLSAAPSPLLFAVSFGLIFFNPYFKFYTSQLCWHAFALAAGSLAYAAAGNAWQFHQWNRRKAILMAVLFAALWHTVVLIPVMIILPWAALDTVLSIRKPHFRKTVLFWACIGFLYLPTFILSFFRNELGYWVPFYASVSNVSNLPLWGRDLLTATGLIFPFLLFISKAQARAALPALVFAVLLLVWTGFFMNGVYEHRIFVYFLLVIPAALASLWDRLGKPGKLLMISLVIYWPVAASLAKPHFFSRYLPPMVLEKQAEAYPYQELARRFDAKPVEENRALLFENRFEAMQTLCRVKNRAYGKRYIGNASKLADEPGYLEKTYPHLADARKIAFATRKGAVSVPLLKAWRETGRERFEFINPIDKSRKEAWEIILMERA